MTCSSPRSRVRGTSTRARRWRSATSSARTATWRSRISRARSVGSIRSGGSRSAGSPAGSERLALRRAENALALLGPTPPLLGTMFVLDAVAYHGLELEPQLAFAALSAIVIARALVSLTRQLHAQRAFLRRLPAARTATIEGHGVHVIPGAGSYAFCVGLVRPAVYVSDGALRAGDRELRAVLAHEEQHRARRDPLRQLLARTVGDALRPLPPFSGLAERQATLANLVADGGAVRVLGGRAALASAMMHFEATGA